MTSKKKVTVLVSLYKAGPFLSAKLATLEAQTALDDCQIILLNCQNLDNEREIYRDFVNRHNNITVVEYTGYKKLYDAWNDGIAISDSNYITNSNVDDVMHPDCLRTLIDALDNNPDYGVAHCDYYVTGHRNQLFSDWSLVNSGPGSLQIHGLIETLYPLGSAGPCPMWRSELHRKYGPFPSKYTIGDALMWQNWHANGVKFLRVPRPLVCYYQENGLNLETRLDEATGRTLRDLDLE